MKPLSIFCAVCLVIALGFGAWYLYLSKAPLEGNTRTNTEERAWSPNGTIIKQLPPLPVELMVDASLPIVAADAAVAPVSDAAPTAENAEVAPAQ